jgi:hypothetical protein
MKKKRAQQTHRANNVFPDLVFPAHEAAVMLLRCELAEALLNGWTGRDLPKRKPPSVSG